MAKVLRPIGHEDRLSIVGHLDELRTRLFVCLGVFLIAFGFCFWQNKPLLKVLNRSLPLSPKTTANHLSGLTNDTVIAAHYMSQIAEQFGVLANSPDQKAPDRKTFAALQRDARGVALALPQKDPQRLPITTGVGEPFTTTLTISAYFALMFSLPLILYQAYAFVLPALNPQERRVALPLMLAAPALFVLGVLFSFFLVLPPAVKFLQGFNNQSFDILLQAKPFYSFEVMTMLGVGLAFQLPIGLLALQRLGRINGDTLIHQWRYAIVIIAIIAAALPGPDVVTTGLETVPLLLLYAVSIVLLKIVDRRALARAARDSEEVDGPLSAT